MIDETERTIRFGFGSALKLIAVLGVALMIFSDINPSQGRERTGVSETLNVPFTSYYPVMTAQSYTGEVLVVVSGAGLASGTDYSDAFYVFSSQGKALSQPLHAAEFGLEIDSRIAASALGEPLEYVSDHIYVFSYDAGKQPRPLAFRIAEKGIQDNTGAFTVRIVPLH